MPESELLQAQKTTSNDPKQAADVAGSEDLSNAKIRPNLSLPFMSTVVVREPKLAERITLWDPQMRMKGGGAAIMLQPGVNILVGPNGSGKSSFLNSFSSGNESERNLVIGEPANRGVRFFMPPKELLSDLKASYLLEGPMMNLQLSNQYRSHGQGAGSVLPLLLEQATREILSKNGKEGLLIGLDEPEGYGLDALAFIKLIESINAAADQGIQFAIASHHPYFLLNRGFNFVPFGDDATYLAKTREAWRKSLAF